MKILFLLAASALMLACDGGDPLAAASSPGEPAAGEPPLALSAVEPASGPVETVVTLSGSGFQREGNTVKFGDGYVKGVASEDGSTLRFVVPDGLDRCAPGTSDPCPGGYARVAAGGYDIAVITSDGTSNALRFTVTER